MFKSKGFTVAFVFLSLLIIFLAVGLFMVTGKKNSNVDFQGQAISTEGNENDISVPSSDTSGDQPIAFPIRETDTHIYPLVNEFIEESGVLSIIESADNSAGVVFYSKLEAYGGQDDESVTNYRGSYETVGKEFLLVNEKPVLVYKTADGFYVGSSKYTNYLPAVKSTQPDASKVNTYGYDSSSGLLLTIHEDDGNHLAFSMVTFDGVNTSPVLLNIVAKYDGFGKAHFDYSYKDSPYNGSLSFGKSDGKVTSVTVRFDAPIPVNGNDISEITLNK